MSRPGSHRLLAWVAAAASALAPAGCRDERAAAPGSVAERPGSLEEWRETRARLDATVWADEVLAQEHERTLVALWDALLAAERSGDASATRAALGQVGLRELRVGTPERSETLEHGIEVLRFSEPFETLDPEAWRRRLEELATTLLPAAQRL